MTDETLLDWRARFTADQVFDATVASARPDRGLVLASRDGGVMSLCAWEVDTGALRPVVGAGQGTGYHWIDPSGRHVYLLADEDGTELGHLLRVPFEGGPAVDLSPELAPYTLHGIGFGADGAAVAFNAVNAEGFSVYVVDAAPVPGPPRLVFRDSWETWGAILSADASLVACWSTARAGGVRRHTLLAFDTHTGERVGELDDGRGSDVVGVAFSPIAGDDRVLAWTTRSGFVRPVLWDARTGARTDPTVADGLGDVAPVAWSPDARAVLACETGGAQRLHRLDLDAGTDRALDHPPGTYYNEIQGGPVHPTPQTIVGLRRSAETAPDVVELDAVTGHPRRTLLDSPDAPPAYPWRSVTFRSADGTLIQAFVATPPGDGPFPTILETHGGPHYTQNEGYDPAVAGWLDHGYAWISPNFRGSTGFGREFREKIWGRLGQFELEDMAAAREWVIAEGIARRDEVFAAGASYGGNLTLLALGRQPDLWAGGLAVAAEGDLVASFHETSDALRSAMIGWMRGTPEQRPEAYAASSPITYAADVRAPILVIQFLNDTRTPPGQLRNYEARLRALGKRIEVHWQDTGHASVSPDDFVDACERMYAFADRVLAERRADAARRS